MPSQASEHMCCQNCYSLLQKMTVLETSFRTLLSEFRNWHSYAAQGLSECGSTGSIQRAEGFSKQRAAETHRAGPAERVDGVSNVSTADRNELNQQWIRVGTKPKRRATYSSVVSSSTPASRAHPAKGNAAAPRSQQTARAGNQLPKMHLQNRFEPLKDLSEMQDESEYHPGRTRRASSLKYPGRTTRSADTADTLIFGDDTVYGVRNRKFLVQCEPDITVSELKEKLPPLLAKHRSVKRIIVHVGKNDTRKRESEVLKRDFEDLFNTLLKLNVQSFISGPLPVRNSNMFSRLFAVNMWLQKRCMSNGLHFIDNFNLFFGKREFFRRDGQHTSKMGDRFLTENLIFSLSNVSVPTSGDTSAQTPSPVITPEPQRRPVVAAKDTVVTPEPQHPPLTENAEISDKSEVPLSELQETPKLHEQSTSSFTSNSPSPHLNFPAAMVKLLPVGTRLSLSLSASPQVQRKISPASTHQSPTQQPIASPPVPQVSPGKESGKVSTMELSQIEEPLNKTPPRPQKKRQAPNPPSDRQLRSQVHHQQQQQHGPQPSPTTRREDITITKNNQTD